MKPENVCITGLYDGKPWWDWKLRIIDFGGSKLARRTGTVDAGTAEFQPPEMQPDPGFDQYRWVRFVCCFFATRTDD
jgi:hypothetical protein